MIREFTAGVRRIGRRVRQFQYRWDGIDIGLIVSTGRTGTNFVETLFSTILDGVDARHEPRPDLFKLGTARMRGELTPQQADAALVDQRLDICVDLHRAGCRNYVEANNNIAYLLPQVERCWPHARIIHLVRDGRDFIRSAYSKTVVSQSRNDVSALFMSDDDKRRRLQACDLADDPYRNAWPSMTRFERMCWYWAKKDALIADALQDHPQALCVRFERLFDRDAGQDCVLEMLGFLGLSGRMKVPRARISELMQRKVNKTDAYLLPRYEQWTDQQKAQFERIAGRHMQRMGYAM